MQEQIDGVDQWLAGLAHLNQGNTHQYRQQDDLQHHAIRECADEGVRDDIEKEFNGATLLTGRLAVLTDGTAIQRVDVDIHAYARLHDVDHNKADDQGDG